MRVFSHWVAVIGLLLLSPLVASAPIVAAASSLKFALDEIQQRYQLETSQTVRLVYGSSGNLYRQIMQGAPYQIFLSADQDYVDRLVNEGQSIAPVVEYGQGRLALFVPHGSSLEAQQGAAGLVAALQEGRLRRFAIANPQHAPYGRAAMHLLKTLGIDESIRPHLVYGENVAQATQFAFSRSVDGVLTAYPLVLTARAEKEGRFQLLDSALYPAMPLSMVQLHSADRESRAFFDFLQGAEASSIFRRYGLRE